MRLSLSFIVAVAGYASRLRWPSARGPTFSFFFSSEQADRPMPRTRGRSEGASKTRPLREPSDATPPDPIQPLGGSPSGVRRKMLPRKQIERAGRDLLPPPHNAYDRRRVKQRVRDLYIGSWVYI